MNLNIYEQNHGEIWENNLPPQYRKDKMISWGTWLATAIQWLHDLLFTNYTDTQTYADWISGSNYVYGAWVRHTDNRVYECVNINGISPSTIAPNLDTDNWIKILDTWIGVRERVYYDGKLIMLEYVLNKWFRVAGVSLPFTGASHSTQIYISRNEANYTSYWMAQDSQIVENVYLAQQSSFSNNWMQQTSTASQPYFFTIHVPTAVYAYIASLLPSGSGTADELIRGIVDQYVRAGREYNIVTY